MTLTEFLLARIAEDEAFVIDACDCWDGPSHKGEVRALHVAQCPARVRAECEAKRQRIRLLRAMEANSDNMLASYAYHLLCLEALPYADHPDYDESWRP